MYLWIIWYCIEVESHMFTSKVYRMASIIRLDNLCQFIRDIRISSLQSYLNSIIMSFLISCEVEDYPEYNLDKQWSQAFFSPNEIFWSIFSNQIKLSKFLLSSSDFPNYHQIIRLSYWALENASDFPSWCLSTVVRQWFASFPIHKVHLHNRSDRFLSIISLNKRWLIFSCSTKFVLFDMWKMNNIFHFHFHVIGFTRDSTCSDIKCPLSL
jgi:hypothetical protein